MKDKASALLVHDYEYPLGDLRPLLDRLGFDTRRARSCAEANFVLAWPEPPTVVFTDTDLHGWKLDRDRTLGKPSSLARAGYCGVRCGGSLSLSRRP